MVLLVEGEMFFRDGDGCSIKHVCCCGDNCQDCNLSEYLLKFGRCTIFDVERDKFVSLYLDKRESGVYWYMGSRDGRKVKKIYVCVGRKIDNEMIKKAIKKFVY